jgi:mono/diheme cytochrome c family protein
MDSAQPGTVRLSIRFSKLRGAILTVAAIIFWSAIANASGAQLFTTHCAICHQANGQGIPAMYPPLANSAGVFAHSNDGRAYLAHVVSFGLAGPIEVDGTAYNGFMQSWDAQLSDDDIAQVLNYVLGNFNSKLLSGGFKPFTAEEIKRDRARTMTSGEVYHELKTIGTASVKADAAK